MQQLNDAAKELIRRPVHAWVTTVRPDGSLQSTVVWVDLDGDDILINTAIGRVKERNLRADDRISIGVLDPDHDHHYVSVSGRARLEVEGADDVIDALAAKYLNVDKYPFRQPGERRINVRVTPDRVFYYPAR